jgi:NitT/TauT family transport system substrate-binding protein
MNRIPTNYLRSNKMNRYFRLGLAILSFSVFSSSGVMFAENKKSETDTFPATMRVAAIIGPSGVGMASLFVKPPILAPGTSVSFETAGSVDVLLPKLLNGDVDIGILPPNVAAKIYNIGKGSVIAGAVVGNGMLALVTRDQSIKTLADLAGKTVSVAGQGSTPEYVTRTLLKKYGLTDDSITLDFSIPSTEIPAALVSNKIDYAILPEPFATVAILNGKADKPLRRAVLLKDAWAQSGFGADFPMTLCVVRKSFAQKYPAAVRKFLDAYRDSIAWTVANPEDAGPLVEKAGLGLKAPIAAKAIPECNFAFVPATEARASIEQLLSVFRDYAPESIGGKLPDDGFYFK